MPIERDYQHRVAEFLAGASLMAEHQDQQPPDMTQRIVGEFAREIQRGSDRRVSGMVKLNLSIGIVTIVSGAFFAGMGWQRLNAQELAIQAMQQNSATTSALVTQMTAVEREVTRLRDRIDRMAERDR